MTAAELITAAHQMRVTDVPGSGFLVDDKPADFPTVVRLAELVAAGLLERASDLPHDTAYLTPTAAGLARLGR